MAYVDFTNVLNVWEQMGVFSYVLPFLLIFALVFAILSKSQILGGNEKNSINAIIAISIALLALQFDIVPTFFATIFPRFAVGLSVFLVVLILTGLFFTETGKGKSNTAMLAVGIVIAVAVIIWSLSSWDMYTGDFLVGYYLQDNFWTIVVGLMVVGAIYAVMRPKTGPS